MQEWLCTSVAAGLGHSVVVAADVQLAHSGLQRGALHAQSCGGARGTRDDAISFLECPQDTFAFLAVDVYKRQL